MLMNALKIVTATVNLTAVSQLAIAAGSYGTEYRTQQFLEALEAQGGTPIEQMSLKNARQVLISAQQGASLPDVHIDRRSITVDDDEVELVVVKPSNTRERLPVFLYFHGGGWVLGDFGTHERLIRDLVVRSGSTAVYVGYTSSPEARFPTAINQAYAATRWVAEHGEEIGVDGTRLAVAGNSVGGNMATVVSLMAKDAGTPAIRFQLLLWPVTDANFNNASYQEYGAGHFLTKDMMEWFWDNYTTDPRERDQVYASPLQASLEQLTGLPPALIQTAEKDVLRDEAEAYGRRLNEAGVDTTVTRYNGMIHDFGLLNPLADISAVQDALDQAGQALQKYLE